mmetsp:Transcript_25209/g.66069  ORF Transcript_25209/g.66069 Transcript_25209/m.66069 type:complete len:412 (-) Transcript_25209:227-1462(-)
MCLLEDMVETRSSKIFCKQDANDISPWDVGAICLPNPVGIQWMVSTIPNHSALYQVSAIATPTCASRAHEQDLGYLKLEDMEYLEYEEQPAGTSTKFYARAAPKDIADRGSCVGAESPCAAAARDVQVSSAASADRPRWASLASDSSENETEFGEAQRLLEPQASGANRARWADLESEDEDGEISEVASSKCWEYPSVQKKTVVDNLVSEGTSASKTAWETSAFSSAAWQTSTVPQSKKYSKKHVSEGSWPLGCAQQWPRNTSWKGQRKEREFRAEGSTAGLGVHNTHGSEKWQCQFIVGIEEEPKFKVTRKVLGSAGANMKDIASRSGAKLRLRGQGSKFLEGPNQEESKDPLMLCISATGQKSYQIVTDLVTELMERVYSEYREFCAKHRWPVPTLRVRMHEGPRSGAR